MQRADFEFDLPSHLIAQAPAPQRSASRLLCLDGVTGAWRDRHFSDLPVLLEPGDLLVFNDTRVVPARVFGAKPSGGRVEMLLERATGERSACVHLRASKPSRAGTQILLPGGESARVVGREDDLYRVEFSCEVLGFFERHGRMPLPPYITREPEAVDSERYQTVFAREPGAVAAPTAGLHFDAPLLRALAARGVHSAFVTLHVGAGTFAPVREQDLDAHHLHVERFRIPAETAAAIARARCAGRRVVAVGTTVVRTLESAALERVARRDAGGGEPGGRSDVVTPGVAAPDGEIEPLSGETRLFIRPGFKFRVVDALVTNFHLPGSTLLMLCAAFAGREKLLAAYRHAVDAQYRFFSYGDAMFITPAPEAGRPERAPRRASLAGPALPPGTGAPTA
ncbi:MAG: tRNA preQ1(34) S-adenosylmethionine ribosyltransferase-isomerase QueA [Proteobacteria bacterium]|nr:tRNA preQ1(34) S-adenosylmethionine ribosyltransferase-isomerase QueA [Pseudomonadota bacterium]